MRAGELSFPKKLKIKNKTEKQLISLCKKENREAFEELLSRDSEYIRGWIRKFSKGNDHLADEIYQITIIKCWQRIKGFKEKCKFSTWATTVARNSFYDEYRKNLDRKFYDIETVIHNAELETRPDFPLVEGKLPSQEIQHEEDVQHAKKLTEQIFNKLKPNQAEVLKMYEGEGLQYNEIAKILNVPVGTVMSRVFYARKKALHVIKKHKYQY